MITRKKHFIARFRRFDDEVLLFINANVKNAFFDRIMPPISYMGNNGAIWLMAAVPLLINIQHRRFGIRLIVALAIASTLGNFVIKPIIGRLRPFESMLELITISKIPLDFSFPSGHTCAAFAAAVVMSRMGLWYGVFWFFFAFVMAFSRMYLFLHYPSDVFGGIILGIISGISALIVY